MLEAVVMALIYICIMVLAVYVILWVLGEVGIALPAQVIKILWIIIALIALLWLVHSALPIIGRL